MRETPILFTGPMVRGVLAGAKRQTRRMMKWQPSGVEPFSDETMRTFCLEGGPRHHWYRFDDPEPRARILFEMNRTRHLYTMPAARKAVTGYLHRPDAKHAIEEVALLCPYGSPNRGDFGNDESRLWVRETWAAQHVHDPLAPGEIPAGARVHYAADEKLGGLLGRPSIFMPRWASRLTLAVESVRVERVQNISPEDIAAEGVTQAAVCDLWATATRKQRADASVYDPNKVDFIPLHRWLVAWSLINGRASWDANPWCWVVGFSRLEQEARAA